MSIHAKKLTELMRLMGGNAPAMGMFEELADTYRNKSEEEIMGELEKLKEDFQQNPKKYQKHMEALEQLKIILDDEQKEKLERWMKYFNA